MFLTPRKERGYLIVTLYSPRRKNERVHRLIALTFISNPENKTTVDHINHIRTDNRVSNLRWATPLEQAHNQIEENFIHHEHAVQCRDKNNHDIVIATFDNCCKAAMTMFNDRNKNSLINRCAQGKCKSAYGYYWTFIN